MPDAVIRPVIRRFLFWSWHAKVPGSFSGESSICCDQPMKQYEHVSREGPPKNRIARCMKCGRQFSFREAAGSGGECDIWYEKVADTDYQVANA